MTVPSDPPLEEMFSAAYEELRRLASLVRSERPGATLSPTTLVNEAFLKLAALPLQGLFTAALPRIVARAMRQVLVEAARRRNASQTGGRIGLRHARRIGRRRRSAARQTFSRSTRRSIARAAESASGGDGGLPVLRRPRHRRKQRRRSMCRRRPCSATGAPRGMARQGISQGRG